jgi:hypothetical protein
VVRGPGFFAVAAADPKGTGSDASSPPIAIASDDGTEDRIPVGPEAWTVGPTPAGIPGVVEPMFEGSARFLLLHGDAGNALGAYDVATHTLRRLGSLPAPVPIDDVNLRFQPPPSYVYDDVQERVWLCGVEAATVSLVSGEARSLPFGCLDLHHQRGGELLLQAPGGAVYALAADGSAETPLGTFPPYAIRAAGGRAFVYVRSLSDEAGDTFTGWVGDTHVVRAGMSPRFSADGQRLYWLEDVALHAGDLWSFDLATRAARHLVRNVTQFDQLPDGRLVAIANAALDGPFNRAVIVDEQAGESRWLAAGVQRLQVVGDAVVVGRRDELTLTFYRVPVPPRGR